MPEMIVAAFDAPSAAQAAIRDLENAQIPSAEIRNYTKDEPAYQEYRTRQPEHQGGFWSWLIGEEPNQTQEYAAYDTSLTSGHTVVTVTVDELHANAVMGILNQHGPHDVHEQASAGSETYQTGSAAYPAAQTASTSGVTGGTQEEVIPLAEEELQVGKRTVDRGTTSIRRYVVRKPVEETVTLRDESVSVERRRPVTQGEAGAPAGAFEHRHPPGAAKTGTVEHRSDRLRLPTNPTNPNKCQEVALTCPVHPHQPQAPTQMPAPTPATTPPAWSIGKYH